MYKVFFKDSCFFLTDDANFNNRITSSTEDTPAPGITHCLHHRNFEETKGFIKSLLKTRQVFRAVILHEDVEALFALFKSCFFYVKAGGGVVRTGNSIAVIKRLGMYDLPKGHLEVGESIEQCALREVQEECGLQEIHLDAHLTDTLHIYEREGAWYLKKTYWYCMTSPAEVPLTPQAEEDIEEAFWLPLKEIPAILPHTYPSLSAVFLMAR